MLNSAWEYEYLRGRDRTRVVGGERALEEAMRRMGGEELLAEFKAREAGAPEISSESRESLIKTVDNESKPREDNAVAEWNGDFWMEGLPNWVSRL